MGIIPPMTVYPLSDFYSSIRQGDEWAIAAILGDRAVALLYLSDVAPELGPHLGQPSWEFMVKQWARKATPDLQQLQALGDVHAGVVTGEGFESRWKLAEWKPSEGLPEQT